MSREVQRVSGLRGRAGMAALGAAAALACAIGAGSAHAYEATGSDFRISNVLPDNDASRVGTNSAVAYNPAANEFLVVFRADVQGDDEFEVYGRRVSAAGAPLGPDFRISNVGDVAANRDVNGPPNSALQISVAYNAAAGEYLAVWAGDHGADEVYDIYGQRISATGVPDLQGDFRISTLVHDDGTRDAFNPDVAYSSTGNEYLVAFQADDLPTEGREEIWAQRVSPAGVPVDSHVRVSDVGPDSGVNAELFDATMADVVFNPSVPGYLVVWQGEGVPTDPPPTEGVTEVWAQRVNAPGTPQGGDIRVSNQGSDTDPTRDAGRPSVAYNSVANQYLVAWRDDGTQADDEFEIYGQRLGPGGAAQGGDTKLSTVNGAGRMAGAPDVAYSAPDNEYLVAWHADALTASGEIEIFTQRVASGGGEISGDTRLSSAGTDGDPQRDATEPALAFGSAADLYLATWTADDLGTLGELEIFGRRLAPAPALAPSPPPRQYDLPKKKCKKKKKKKKKKSAAGSAKKKKKKKKKKCK